MLRLGKVVRTGPCLRLDRRDLVTSPACFPGQLTQRVLSRSPREMLLMQLCKSVGGAVQ